MGEIIDLNEYLKSKRNFRTVKVDTVKKVLKEEQIGDFWGLTDQEENTYYEELTDALNDMVERPCGETAYKVGNILAERKIKSYDFDRVYELIRDNKTMEFSENMLKETENANVQEVPEFIEYTDDENKLDAKQIKEFEIIYDDEKREDEFYKNVLATLQDITDEIQKSGSQKYQKASTPFKVNSDIVKEISDSVEGLEGNQEFASMSPEDATKLASIVGQVKSLENEVEEAKPRIKSQLKKLEFKGTAKKGIARSLKEKIEKIKAKKSRDAIEDAREYSEIILDIEQSKYETNKINLERLKNNYLKERIKLIRQQIDIDEIDMLRADIKSKRNRQVDSLRKALDEIQTSRVKAELKSQIGLNEEEIQELIYGVNNDAITKLMTFGEWKTSSLIGLNTDGTLQISPKSILQVKDIEGTLLEEELRKIAAMPRVQDLTDEEVLQLAKSIKVQDGKIRVNFSYLFDGKTPGDLSWTQEDVVTMLPNGVQNQEEAKKVKKDFEKYVNGKSKQGTRLQYFKNMYGKDLYVYGMELTLPEAQEKFEEIGVYDSILIELDNLERLHKAKVFDKQISDMSDKLEEIEDKRKLTRKDKRTRDTLRKVAESKTEEIEKQGIEIIDVITETGKKAENLIKIGKEKLTTKGLIQKMGKSFGLIQDKENDINMDKVINTKKKELDKTLDEK